ncbi:hypothetical protein ACFB49_43580 [Sphingomonas sp. DBB INV C78]|uniref:SRPBCC domain-containing protein n=1 Tax=Sphingomonas sp. DBB INV C78 TaxID=3349434 RepID=UPI0036D374D0
MSTGTPVLLKVSRFYRTTPEALFDAWLDPERARHFLFATDDGEMQTVEIDARVGGGFHIVERRPSGDAAHHGRFVAIDRPRWLEFLFLDGPDAETGDRVTVAIVPEGDGARLTLTHAMRADMVEYEDRTRTGWTTILDKLAPVAEPEDDHGREIAPETLRFERLLPASVDRVWRWLIEDERRSQWFAAGTIEPQPGGAVRLVFDHDNLSTEDVPYPVRFLETKGFIAPGEVIECDPPRMIAFHWGGGDDLTRFELEDAGSGQTRLILTHTRLKSRQDRVGTAAGWHAHLAVLAAKLADGGIRDFWAIHEQAERDYERLLS